MKRIFTLLWLTLSAISFHTSAQTTVCNAEFSVQYMSAATVKFNPVVTGGTPQYQHTWVFGDGSTSSSLVSPTHTYVLPGTYTAVHTIIRYNNNNIPECTQSFTKIVTIQSNCNLQANFSSSTTAANPLVVQFHNTSTPIHPSDSVKWTFGDGTSLSGLQSDPNIANPLHTYAQAGAYNVCIRVKKNNSTTPPQCVSEFCRTVVVTQPCNLQVYFTAQNTAANPLQVHFTNHSAPVQASDSVKWTFGDGTSLTGVYGNPAVANPTHTYAQAGTYNVCLVIKKNNSSTPNNCVREFCKTVVVTNPCNLVADFTTQQVNSNPLSIKFTNTSTPSHASDSIKWTFGDGTSLTGIQGDPNVAAPIHHYANPGTYTVCIRVKKNNTANNYNCVREFCKTVVVTQPCNLQAYFTAEPVASSPLKIKFTNQSVPSHATDSIHWTFGDGSSLSGVQADPNVAAPLHTYSNPGTYTVCIRVKKNSNVGSTTPPCVREFCKTIVIPPPCNIQASFTWRLDSANQLKVIFTNTTAAPTATSRATWSFGDGSTASTWHATHTYNQPGRYRVCVKVEITPNCIREFCDTVVVPHPVPACTQLSKFRFEKASNDNQRYKFTPEYLNTTLQYTWTFGDGTGSQDPIATHRYAQPGVYTACLTVWRGPNCASTTCKEIRVLPQINCDTAHVTYSYQPNPLVPNKIHFYANGTLPILNQTWTIVRLNGTVATPPVILNQNNPVYLFQDTGLYKVCLRAVLLGGCVKEVCQYIRIQQVANVCELQAYPNPTSSTINVNVTLTQPELIHAYVYNSLNVLVLDKRQQGFTGNNLVSMNVSNLTAGQYTIKLVYGNRICYARFQKL